MTTRNIYINSTHNYVVSFASYISQLPQKLNKEDIHQTSQYDKMSIDFIEVRPSSPVNIHSLKLHHYPTKERKIQEVINTFQAFTLYTNLMPIKSKTSVFLYHLIDLSKMWEFKTSSNSLLSQPRKVPLITESRSKKQHPMQSK